MPSMLVLGADYVYDINRAGLIFNLVKSNLLPSTFSFGISPVGTIAVFCVARL